MNEARDHQWLRQGSTTSTEVRSIYDDWARTYDGDLAAWDYQAPAQAARRLSAVLDPDAAVLDVGCGTGLTGLALREAGFNGRLDGLDLSPVSLELAAEREIYRGLATVDLQQDSLPGEDNAYDGLLCVGVLTYVPQAEACLREFARVVRSGGCVVFTQREDLFVERGDRAMLERLADVFAEVSISEPMRYLPRNPDFQDEVRVIYVVARVA